MQLAARFLALSPTDRAAAFGQAATVKAVSSVMIEKDFWVCWLLGVVFADRELAPHIVFKGGTSLSKVYGVIDRFSEDIDLSLSPVFVGADEARLDQASSRAQRDLAMRAMQDRCADKVRDFVAPRLETAIAERLGPPGADSWLRYEDDPNSRSPVIHFRYPTSETPGFDYLRREVKLEMGSLTDQQPTERNSIRPWVADEFSELFAGWTCSVTALELARTFWEKATILHAEHHRPADSTTPDRYSRHYSDMARLVLHPRGEAMLQEHALCERVVQWKSRMFTSRWANYEAARPGSFRLVPAEPRVKALEKDYAQMTPMFLSQPPPFEEVIATLVRAENHLNLGGDGR